MGGRRSVARQVSLSGVGLHTGRTTTLTFRPAGSGAGVAFRRSDLSGHQSIPATVENVVLTDRRTTLGNVEDGVQTVEHVLAAVAAHQIDDLLIEVDGPEAPIFDGSARPYFQALRDAGLSTVAGEPRYYRPGATVTVREADATYVVSPASGLRLTVTIEWAHPLIGRQSGSYDVAPEVFDRELAGARTFGFEQEIAGLRAEGLIRGGGLSNAIVLSPTGLIGTELHWPDEFVRHKAVDLLGDLALLGGRLDADVTAFRPSHAGNVALARTLRRTTPTGAPTAMGIEEILKVLPHRYPMLLVDRILEVQGTQRIVGIKNVTINEPFFQGHFPGHPVMPGVLIVEAMAQVGGVLLMSTLERPQDSVVYFMSIDGVKFRRPVVPGDQIRFEVETVQVRGKTVKMRGVGLVEGKVAAEAEFMAMIAER
ncbi:MAG: UDP-3-O-[3-hydroxymyristoyl] N-acetylglucosamine deacetylase [Gemmatimonadetes bacterium]|nr:UDP-3-O-[3-hydroxymyristoyl] N-acetylglucosamine deacetylase [Gemmatimonadota bacterium]